MSIRSFFAGLFGGAQKPQIRPGGLAFIRGIGPGASELNGRVVTTVALDGHGHWLICPRQWFKVDADVTFHNGNFCHRGVTTDAIALAPEHLIPIEPPGVTDQEVADLYGSGLPVTTKEEVA